MLVGRRWVYGWQIQMVVVSALLVDVWSPRWREAAAPRDWGRSTPACARSSAFPLPEASLSTTSSLTDVNSGRDRSESDGHEDQSTTTDISFPFHPLPPSPYSWIIRGSERRLAVPVTVLIITLRTKFQRFKNRFDWFIVGILILEWNVEL